MTDKERDKLLATLIGKIAGLEAKLDYISQHNENLKIPNAVEINNLTVDTIERYETAYPLIKDLHQQY